MEYLPGNGDFLKQKKDEGISIPLKIIPIGPTLALCQAGPQSS